MPGQLYAALIKGSFNISCCTRGCHRGLSWRQLRFWHHFRVYSTAYGLTFEALVDRLIMTAVLRTAAAILTLFPSLHTITIFGQEAWSLWLSLAKELTFEPTVGFLSVICQNGVVLEALLIGHVPSCLAV